MKVVLELQDQPSNVRRITIRHDIVIGRGSDCNLRLSAPQVSRRHCFLRVGRDSVSVTDLDSSNGTFVDGRRIAAGKRCSIADGVQLALGPIRFIVHVQADGMVAESAKLKSAAGNADEFPGAAAGRYSAAQRDLDDDGSTIDGRSQSAQAIAPMDYAVEQAGESAEPHAATAEHLENQFSVFGSAQFFPSDPDPMDSRLEIVDFGRRLSEESSSVEETRSLFSSKNTGRAEMIADEEPQWASAIIESSESPEDVDVLSIADDSGVDCNFEDDRRPKAATSSGDAGNVEIVDADESPQTIESGNGADGVQEIDGKSDWFSGADADHQTDGPDALTDAADRVNDDEIDPNLQDFIKGF